MEGVRSDDRRYRAVMLSFVGIIAFVLAAMALRNSIMVTMPLVFSFFIAVLLFPIHSHLRNHIHRWVSLAATMLVFVAVIALFVGAIWVSVEMVNDKAGPYADRFEGEWSDFVGWAQGIGLPVDESELQSRGFRERLMGFIQSGLGSAWSVMVFLVLAFFLTLLMLIETDIWKEKIKEAMEHRHAGGVLHTVVMVAIKIRQYLWVRTMVSALSAVLSGILLWACGVDFWLMWAMLIFLLNFVPNIGSIISAIPPILLAFVQFGVVRATGVAVGLLVIEQVIGNFIDPRLQGKRLEISPIVVLISVLFWSYLWGAAGALLAVPITVTLMIVLAQIDATRPAALMLSNTSDETEFERRMNEVNA